MPIDLTTQWQAGSADSGATYSQAKIIEFRMGLEHNKRLELCVEFGDTVDGNWVRGRTGAFKVELRDTAGEGTDFSDFYAANAALVSQVAAVLYAKLQELEPTKAAGAVV